jgi:hypothetical protein
MARARLVAIASDVGVFPDVEVAAGDEEAGGLLAEHGVVGVAAGAP